MPDFSLFTQHREQLSRATKHDLYFLSIWSSSSCLYCALVGWWALLIIDSFLSLLFPSTSSPFSMLFPSILLSCYKLDLFLNQSKFFSRPFFSFYFTFPLVTGSVYFLSNFELFSSWETFRSIWQAQTSSDPWLQAILSDHSFISQIIFHFFQVSFSFHHTSSTLDNTDSTFPPRSLFLKLTNCTLQAPLTFINNAKWPPTKVTTQSTCPRRNSNWSPWDVASPKEAR